MLNYNTKITSYYNINKNINNLIFLLLSLIIILNLNIDTKTLTYSDIINFNNTTTKGSGLSTGIGTSADNFFKGTNPNGTTTITHTNEGSEKEGITRATIGNGNITIANKEVSQENNNLDLIGNLNRNVDSSQEIAKDMITGALDRSVTVDNRLFTKDGREDIVDDFKNFIDNTYNVLDQTAFALIRATDINRISYYGNRAFADEKNDSIPDKERVEAHELAAEAYGNYVGSSLVGGAMRLLGETGQFFMYTGQDIYSRIAHGKPGPYQPYKFSSNNGGLIDSYNDIMNVVRGANRDYMYQPNQESVNKYNNQDYKKYINNGKKW